MVRREERTLLSSPCNRTADVLGNRDVACKRAVKFQLPLKDDTGKSFSSDDRSKKLI